MSTESERPALERYWAIFEPSPKRFSPAEQHATVVLYRELATGQPLGAERLARALDVPPAQARELLGHASFRTFLQLDDDARVVGFRGLTLRPMHHRFEVDGRALSTWCAWDSLFIPEILGRPASVTSFDPENGQPIRLVIAPDGIKSVEPKSAVISLVPPDAGVFGTSASNVMAKFCHFVFFFFSSRDSGERWITKHRGTFLCSLEDAFALAQRANARIFGTELVATSC